MRNSGNSFAQKVLRAGPQDILVSFDIALLFTRMPQVTETLNPQVDIYFEEVALDRATDKPFSRDSVM
jgi:hypothetical protein